MSVESRKGYSQSVSLDSGTAYISVEQDEHGDDVIVALSEKIVPTGGPTIRSAGLVDLQVNGFAGLDFNDDTITADKLDQSLLAMLKTGVTTCLPTLITSSADKLRSRLRALDAAVQESQLGPLMVPGYHLEGPFLNPEAGYAGSHPAEHMVSCSVELIDTIQAGLSGSIVYITLAPEIEGAIEFIQWAKSQGIIVGAGHTAMSQAVLDMATENGMRVSTHLGNGLPHMLPKFNNPLLSQLSDDRLVASFIADGIHIPPDTLRFFVRSKGIKNSILVTDAISAAGCEAGTFVLAGIEVEATSDGVVRIPKSKYLAGSTLTMDQALRNVIKWNVGDFRAALKMACANPINLIAPALAARNIVPVIGEIEWTPDFHPRSVRINASTTDVCLEPATN